MTCSANRLVDSVGFDPVRGGIGFDPVRGYAEATIPVVKGWAAVVFEE
jgi:hypothetical protein